MNKICRIILFTICFILIYQPLLSQKDRYPGTKLADPDYFENKIKYIYDEELFNSMDLNRSGLEKVKEYVEKKDFQRAYEEWGKYWSQKNQPRIYMPIDRIFSTFDEEELKLKNDIDAIAVVLKEAGKIQNHEINGWGDVTIKFGPVVDFNANFGDSGKYGFHYWIWSLPLIRAYILSKDNRYIKAFDELFNQWYSQRYRVSYVYSNFDNIYYDLGLGARSRIFISNYYINYKERDWLTHERMLKTMLGAARWLFQQASYGYRVGNSQALGTSTLGVIGFVFPEFKESKEWIEMSVFRLYEHAKKDFFEDGGHSERSPYSYAVLTYNQIRNIVFMMDKFNYNSPLKDEIKTCMSRSVDWWISMLAPNGDIPAINDCHRVECPAEILEDGATYYGNKYAHGILYNILGHEKYKGSAVPPYTSINLVPSAFAIMRTDWTPNALYMNINYGKWSEGHTHPDILDFEIYAYGKPLAIDAGIGKSYDDTLHFKWYKTSNAHNMVVINDSNLNRLETEGENPFWANMKNLDYFSAENKGYKSFGVKQKREFVFVKPNYWIIIDKIISDGRDNKATWNIHTADNLENNSDEYYKSASSRGLIIYPLEKYNSKIKKGPAMIRDEKKNYVHRELDWLQFEKNLKNKEIENFIVALIPFDDSSLPVKVIKGNSGEIIVVYKDFVDEIFYDNQDKKYSNFESDGRICWIRKHKGEIINSCMIDGRYLKYFDKYLFKSDIKTNYEK